MKYPGPVAERAIGVTLGCGVGGRAGSGPGPLYRALIGSCDTGQGCMGCAIGLLAAANLLILLKIPPMLEIIGGYYRRSNRPPVLGQNDLFP